MMLAATQQPPPPPPSPTKSYVTGKVSTADKKAVAGTKVVLESLDDSTRRYETTTFPDGSYTFAGVPVGQYVLKVYSNKGGVVLAKRINHRPRLKLIVENETGIGNRKVHWEYQWPESTVDVKVAASTATPTPSPSNVPTPKPTQSPTVTPAPTVAPSAVPTANPTPSQALNPSPNPTLQPSPAATASPGSQQSPTPGSTPGTKIDQILASMEFGNISFNVPPTMSLQKAEEVTLLLSLKQTSDQLAQQLKSEGMGGDIKEAQIKVHDRMQAVITGDGFQITQVTPDTLPVSKEQPTEWKWEVRAQRTGTLNLHVTLNAIVDVDDGSGPRPYPIRTFSQTYLVKVAWSDAISSFVAENWKWLWTTLIVPVGLWFLKRRRDRQKARGPAGFTPPEARP